MVAPGQGISVVKVLPIEGVCPSMDSMVKGCSKGRIKEGGKIVLRGLWIGYQIFMSFIYIYRVILHSRLVSVQHNLPSKMKFIIVG